MIGRLLATLRRRRLQRDLDDEMAFHLEAKAADLRRAGSANADSEARRAFGNVTALKEEARAFNVIVALENTGRDMWHAARSLGRSPVFAATAIAMLAVGIGANTAIYSLMDQVLNRMLPVEKPEELVWLNPTGPGYSGEEVSYPLFRDLQARQQVFAGVFGRVFQSANLGHAGRSERVMAELVSGAYFSTLRVPAHIGRVFTEADDATPGAHPVAVLSHSFWQSRFKSDPAVVGQTIVLNGGTYTVVGVVADWYRGLDIRFDAQVRVPISMQRQMMPDPNHPEWNAMASRASRWVNVYARLKPGVDLARAEASLQPVFQNILAEENFRPGDRARIAMRVMPGSQPEMVNRSQLRRLRGVVFTITVTVLLIACANLASLLLARMTARRREFAIRLSLGASRAQLVRQLLAESLLLAALGGAFAIFVASAVSRAALTFAPSEMETAISTDLDAVAIAFNFLIAAAAALVFGLMPALATTRPDVAPSLKEPAGAGSNNRLRKALVVAQVALSLGLVVAAALLVQSLRNVKLRDLGFSPGGLVLFSVDPLRSGYDGARTRAFRERLVEKLKATPGITAAGFSRAQLLGGSYNTRGITVEGVNEAAQDKRWAFVDTVSEDYFSTLGLSLARGRFFTRADAAPTFRAAIVNEAFVRTFLGERDAIGVHIGTGARGTPLEIIGVTKDSAYSWVKASASPVVYLAASQDPAPDAMTVYVRSSLSRDAVSPAIRAALRELDANLPLFELRSMDTQINFRLTAERFLANFSAWFGAIALALAVVGLYGLIAFLAARRTREIGVRIALGAFGADIVRLILRDALALVAVGVAAGLLLGLGAGRALASELYELSPYDAVTFIAAPLALIAVSAMAAFVPAWRAAKTDPNTALRTE